MNDRTVAEILQEWVNFVNQESETEFLAEETIDLSEDNVTITQIDDMSLDTPDKVLSVTHHTDGTVDISTENYEFFGVYPCDYKDSTNDEPIVFNVAFSFAGANK